MIDFKGGLSRPFYIYFSGDFMKKKLLSLFTMIISLILMLTAFPVTTFAAADFNVEDGILLSYKGNSQSVTIPSDVYYIADSAFEGNSSITTVNLNNTSVIGNKAFANCTSLKTVTGSGNVSACGAYSFYNTPFLKSYNSKSLVMGSMLVYSTEPDDVIIDSGVVSIAPYAFSYNTAITSVRIGDNVASIGEGAFYNCTKLSEAIVSKRVTYIGAFAFEGTKFLSAVDDDFLVLGNGILVDVNSKATDITIPDSVCQIGAGAFYNNKSLVKVTIPDTVTSIGMRAFAGCTSLRDAMLPQNLVLLDKEAFSGCTSLESVIIPASVAAIGESAFLGCTSLKTAQVLSSTSVSDGMFASCTGLESVMLSQGAERIGDYAFYNCKKLSELSVPPSVNIVSDTAFSGADNAAVWCAESSMIELYCVSNGIDAYIIGDANKDGNINIRDATDIQKSTAKILTMDFSSCLRGDADFSGDINIRDATAIQKYVAGIN